MLNVPYDYEDCIRSSERVRWTVDEVMPPGTALDFTLGFLPDNLAGTSRLAFLPESTRMRLNHISANAYLNLFSFVEEYILAQMTNHAMAELFGDHNALRALVRFVDEELKHQQLFARYREAFDRDFGSACDVLSSAVEVAGVILAKSSLAVMLTTLHIELMTQQHYTESVRDNPRLDPFFVKLLHHHWLEESQHARIDTLELDRLASAATAEDIERGFDEYLELIDAFDGLLANQARMDIDSLARALGQPVDPGDAERIVAAQHASYRHTFLVLGMTNRTFAATLSKLSPSGAQRVAAKARALSAP